MKKMIILLLFLGGCVPQESPKPLAELDMKILQALEEKYKSEKPQPKTKIVYVPVYYQSEPDYEIDDEPESIVKHKTISVPTYESPVANWQLQQNIQQEQQWQNMQRNQQLQDMQREQQWQSEQLQFNQMNQWIQRYGR